MIQLHAAAVGDGLCVRLQTGAWSNTQVDCGSQQDEDFAFRGWLRQDVLRHPLFGYVGGPNAFIISHYHTDHYNGAMWASDQKIHQGEYTALTNVLGPGMPVLPKVPDTPIFLRALLASSIYVAGSRSGHMETDLVRAIMRLNGGNPVRYRRVFAGDSIRMHDSVLRVIWPPRELKDEEVAKPMRTVITQFEDVLERHEDFRGLDSAIQKSEIFRAVTDLENDDHLVEPEASGVTFRVERATKVPADIRTLNEAARAVANSLSLAFYIDGAILFLGDLPKRQLKRVVARLIADNATTFELTVAAHHGTTWTEELASIRSSDLYVSCGSKLLPHFQTDWAKLTRRIRLTAIHGDLSNR